MPTLIPSDVDALTGISVGLAQSPLERQRALELLRTAYVRKGLLQEEIPRLRVLPQACTPGSAIFVAREHDDIVGTITVYRDSAIGLPIDGVHRADIDEVRDRVAPIAEVGSLATREDRRGRGITAILFLAAFRWAVVTKIQCIVACVNPSYRRLYSKMLRFEVLGQCRAHPRFQGSPSIPIGLDLSISEPRLNGTHRASSERLRKLLQVADPARAFGGLGSASYLQWSDDEISEMIRTEQLLLGGHEHRYVARHYLTKEIARSPQ
jgi:GNAT superfamily N-acetyltransferase